MESTWTPRSSHAWSARLIARTPARWPKLAGRPRRRAQRPLPSMMIPMWRGTCESKSEERVPTGRIGVCQGCHGRVHAGRPGSSHLVARAAEFTSSATRVANRLQAKLVEGYSINPDHIPEGEQARRRSRPADEWKPYGFPLIFPWRPSSPRPRRASPNRLHATWWKATQSILTVYRKESRPAGEAGRPRRGNHMGFLSYLHYLVLL